MTAGEAEALARELHELRVVVAQLNALTDRVHAAADRAIEALMTDRTTT